MTLRPRPSSGEAQAEIAGSGQAARTIIPLPAFAPQVFEVTDLIPAGTDLDSGYVLHDFGPLPSRSGVFGYVSIELAAPLAGSPGGSGLSFGLALDLTFTNGFLTSALNEGDRWADLASGNPVGAGAALDRAAPLGAESPDLCLAIGASVHIGSPQLTTADIHVVRARASFLVI